MRMRQRIRFGLKKVASRELNEGCKLQQEQAHEEDKNKVVYSAGHYGAACARDPKPVRTPCRVRLGPSISIDRAVDGKRRLSTPDEMQHKVASLREAGFAAPTRAKLSKI
jgi:hypothetical protein